MKKISKFSWFVLAMLVIVQAAEAEVLRVTGLNVKLRSEPTTASSTVAMLAKGTVLEVVEKNGSWYMVKVPTTGQTGYIHRVLVQVVEGQTGAMAQPPAARPTPPPAAQPQPAAKPQPTANPPTAVPPAPATKPPSEDYARAQSMEQPPDRGMDLTLWGGILAFDGSNLSGGAALAFPLGGPHTEIEMGGEYARFGGVDADFSSSFGPSANVSSSGSLISMTGSLNYNFQLPQSRIVPYASGGMVWARSSGTVTASVPVFGLEERVSASSSEAALQFGGGVKFPVGDGSKSVRGDIRFELFDGDTATRVFMGIVF